MWDFNSLESVDEVDGLLGEKRHQLYDAQDGNTRAVIREQMDALLEIRHALGGMALEGSDDSRV